MPHYALQWTLHTADNVPANFVTNTWSFNADDLTALNAAITETRTFYGAIKTTLGSTLAQNGHTYKAFNRADARPQVPVQSGVFNFASSMATSTLPTEVAICLSFNGAFESGVSVPSKRGRLYIGPLSSGAAGSDGFVISSYMTSINNAAIALKAASDASTAWSWEVWSETNSIGSPVVAGFVNNEFDTQRRRGRKSTTRLVF